LLSDIARPNSARVALQLPPPSTKAERIYLGKLRQSYGLKGNTL